MVLKAVFIMSVLGVVLPSSETDTTPACINSSIGAKVFPDISSVIAPAISTLE